METCKEIFIGLLLGFIIGASKSSSECNIVRLNAFTFQIATRA